MVENIANETSSKWVHQEVTNKVQNGNLRGIHHRQFVKHLLTRKSNTPQREATTEAPKGQCTSLGQKTQGGYSAKW